MSRVSNASTLLLLRRRFLPLPTLPNGTISGDPSKVSILRIPLLRTRLCLSCCDRQYKWVPGIFGEPLADCSRPSSRYHPILLLFLPLLHPRLRCLHLLVVLQWEAIAASPTVPAPASAAAGDAPEQRYNHRVPNRIYCPITY